MSQEINISGFHLRKMPGIGKVIETEENAGCQGPGGRDCRAADTELLFWGWVVMKLFI